MTNFCYIQFILLHSSCVAASAAVFAFQTNVFVTISNGNLRYWYKSAPKAYKYT